MESEMKKLLLFGLFVMLMGSVIAVSADEPAGMNIPENSAPEFPILALPAALIVAFFGAVLFLIQRNRKE